MAVTFKEMKLSLFSTNGYKSSFSLHMYTEGSLKDIYIETIALSKN